MHTISDLLNTIDRLPAPDRWRALQALDACLEYDGGALELALGLLALDLVDLVGSESTDGLMDRDTDVPADSADRVAHRQLVA